MKNIILIISLLFYSFSVVNEQKYVFFKSPWKGDVTVAKESKGGKEKIKKKKKKKNKKNHKKKNR